MKFRSIPKNIPLGLVTTAAPTVPIAPARKRHRENADWRKSIRFRMTKLPRQARQPCYLGHHPRILGRQGLTPAALADTAAAAAAAPVAAGPAAAALRHRGSRGTRDRRGTSRGSRGMVAKQHNRRRCQGLRESGKKSGDSMKVVDLLRALECMRDVLNSHPDLSSLRSCVSIFGTSDRIEERRWRQPL